MVLKHVSLLDATFYPVSPRNTVKTLASIRTNGCQPSIKNCRILKKSEKNFAKSFATTLEDHSQSQHHQCQLPLISKLVKTIHTTKKQTSHYVRKKSKHPPSILKTYIPKSINMQYQFNSNILVSKQNILQAK